MKTEKRNAGATQQKRMFVAGVIETIRGIEGNFISENANQQYNEAIVYPVSKDQYLAAKQKTE